MRSGGLVIDTIVCLTLAKWETVSGRFGGYLKNQQAGLCCGVGTPADEPKHSVLPSRGGGLRMLRDWWKDERP
jgi:hypothetical protein